MLDDVITIINKYFPELISEFEGLSMQEITREFNTEEAIENIAQICVLSLDEAIL